MLLFAQVSIFPQTSRVNDSAKNAFFSNGLEAAVAYGPSKKELNCIYFKFFFQCTDFRFRSLDFGFRALDFESV